ncbi:MULTISPECIES: hypothetical protein [Streptomyces]|uniref:hypothetical protein n=1 Tax=Streptomyces TaxID=1883 RepID=UPI001E37F4B4|nr:MULTISPECIES: hypothetical protein [Streptomyces]
MATVPREVTPGLRPVVGNAGVDQELIDWSSTRRQRVEDVLEGITDQYVKDHGRLPGERARHGLGQRLVGGLLQRCQTAGAAIRARVGPIVDTEPRRDRWRLYALAPAAGWGWW